MLTRGSAPKVYRMEVFPAHSGSYVLWLRLGRKRRIQIGRLGEQLFSPGYYAYTGSAFGPGGLRARLTHHLKKSPRPHWHIDYLKNCSAYIDVWFSSDDENREHRWAEALSSLSGATVPITGFGASDCTCRSHLLHFASLPDISLLKSICPETNPTRSTL